MWTTMISSSTLRTRQSSWVGEALSLLPCHSLSEGVIMAEFPACMHWQAEIVYFQIYFMNMV